MTDHLSQDIISQWLDRELDSRTSAEVAEHLGVCESCRAFENEMSEVNRIYRSMEALEPSPHLWTRISASFEETRKERHGFFGLTFRPVWSRARALAIAAVFVLMICSAVLYVEYRVTVRAEQAAIAEIDRAHSALLALSVKNHNPFHEPTGVDVRANPFAQVRLKDQPNPFRTLAERP